MIMAPLHAAQNKLLAPKLMALRQALDGHCFSFPFNYWLHVLLGDVVLFFAALAVVQLKVGDKRD